jgi:hypothetical protein
MSLQFPQAGLVLVYVVALVQESVVGKGSDAGSIAWQLHSSVIIQ